MSLLTVKEIASILKVKESWIYCHADEIGAYHLGKYLRFSWPRVLECLENNSRSLGCVPNDPLKHIAFTAHKTDREPIGNKILD